jgi:mycothiol synthase
MTTLTRFQARPYAGEADLAALVELQQTAEATDHLDRHPTLTEWQHWLTAPQVDPARDLRLWEDADGRLVAAGWLWLPVPGTEAEAGVLDAGFTWEIYPTVRRQGLEDEIVAWAEGAIAGAAAERGQPAVVYADSDQAHAYGREVLETRGYTTARYFFLMRRSLNEPIPTPELPEGYTVTTVQSEVDILAWIDMFNLSFIDHWNFHPSTLERRRHRMQNPAYRPEGDLVAVAPDGTFAAFCTCYIHDEENAAAGRLEGWIGTLGTRRGYRKIGLGRAMLLRGIEYLKGQGLDWALLGVDATNPTGALRLYESVGFNVDRTEIAYSKTL